ncbi:MAG: 3-oxoacyl-ACP reductase FabG [Lachnospiraceae bacterium]
MCEKTVPKTVLITGSSRGIGKAIAILFAQADYHVWINCKSSAKELQATAQEIQALSTVSGKPCCCTMILGDVGNETDVTRIFQRIADSGTGVDILINNAGISSIGLFTDMTGEGWNQMLQTNLSSVFYCSKAALPYMLSKKMGKIITISSMWGTVGASCEVAYSAAKSGVHGLTRALAKELAPSNIQVNAIACGAIDTAMNSHLSPAERTALEEEIPMGRYGTPKEVAELVLQVAQSPAYMTGQIIGIDGGFI